MSDAAVVAPAEVVATGAVGVYRVVHLRAPAVAASSSPGQFVMIATAPGSPTVLRRPFSLYAADPAAGTVAVAFDAVGPGTRWLAGRAPGETLDVVGPLGTPFGLPEGPTDCLLVGGGYGTAALIFLAHALNARGCGVDALVGARTAERLFVDPDLERIARRVSITTDDGSAGTRGVVTDSFAEAVADGGIARAYACGPNPMLAAVGERGGSLGVPTEVAVEEFMACGIGVCWTCVLPVEVDGEVRHRRTCTDGPVFAGGAIRWE